MRLSDVYVFFSIRRSRNIAIVSLYMITQTIFPLIQLSKKCQSALRIIP